jgi:hypothetical protein
MIAYRIFMGAGLVLSLTAVLEVNAVRAQTPQSARVEAAIRHYDSGDMDQARLSLQALAADSSMAQSDRAIVWFYVGLVDIVDGQGRSAQEAFWHAAALDPTLEPNPRLHAPTRIRAFEEARAQVPVLDSVWVPVQTFRPLMGELAGVHFRLAFAPTDSSLPPPTASLYLRASKVTTAPVQGDTGTLQWSGLVGGAPPPSGTYPVRVTAQRSQILVATSAAAQLKVTVTAPLGSKLDSLPPAPELLPTSAQKKVTDGGAATLGKVMAVASVATFIGALAVCKGSEENGDRCNYWRGGFFGSLSLALIFAMASSPHLMTVVLQQNIDENYRHMAEWNQRVQAIRKRNDEIRASVRIRIEPADVSGP